MSASDIVGYHPPGITRDHHHAWDTFFTALTRDGYTPEEAGQLAGIAPATQAKWFKHFRDIQLAAQADRRAREPADDTAPPKREEELCPQARKALEDFDYFRVRYMGRYPTPWQKKAADAVQEYLSTPHKEFLVINVAPGSGKSTLFVLDIPLWLLCKNRRLRTMIGSRTERQAAQYVARVRRTLMQRIPPERGEATLMHDFGSFKPAERDIWRRGDFIVAQNVGVNEYGEKDSSFAAYGYDSAFLGGRFDLVIWDDLVDRHVLKSVEAREAMQNFWDTEAETRLEPGGLLILQGQRLDADDLYRYALNLRLEDDAPKYRHIVFKAHDEERCEEQHDTNAPYWPEGCLLDPVRVPWRDLAAKRIQNWGRYETIYQQNDVDEASALVRQLWLDGGEEHGVTYRGCWDNRAVRYFPHVDPGATVSVVGVDPSPTRSWGLTWWLYDRSTDERHLIDCYCGPMTTPELLDCNHNGTWSGIMHRWQTLSESHGYPITAWIVEVNSAQRWLLQLTHVQRWATQHRTTLVPHTTSARKRDPAYGPGILGPLYRDGLIRLPARSRAVVQPLVEDVVRWHPETTFTCDSMMSQWFVEANIDVVAPRMTNARRWTPSWLGGDRAWVASGS